LDASGKTIRKFTGKPQPENAQRQPRRRRAGEPNLPTEIGLNQFVWNYRLPNATGIPGLIMWGGSLAGPKVAPGNYQVRFSVDGKASRPKVSRSKPTRDFDDDAGRFSKTIRFDVENQRRNFRNARSDSGNPRRSQTVRRFVGQNESPSKKICATEPRHMKKLTAVEEELMQTKIKSSQDALNYPIKLNNKLAALASAVDSADYAPTNQSYDVYNDLTEKLTRSLRSFGANQNRTTSRLLIECLPRKICR
jgi:hypothetical protein